MLSQPSPVKSAKSWTQWCRKTLLISCSTKNPNEASKLLNVASDLCKATAEATDLFCSHRPATVEEHQYNDLLELGLHEKQEIKI